MKRIAIYGKGGIGKSTVTTALATTYALAGKSVLVMGCDPKHDTASHLVERFPIPTIMGCMRDKGERALALDDFFLTGRHGIHCIEIGGPQPGMGCAGRGITKAFELLTKMEFDYQRYDIIIYDVLGDVVCGGFAAPLHSLYTKEVYIVVSGETMALYAANNICHAVSRAAVNGIRLGGLIANLRDVPNERAIIEAFAARLGTSIAAFIPRSEVFHTANQRFTTVMDIAPDSPAARAFSTLADIVTTEKTPGQLNPMGEVGFEEFIRHTIPALSQG